eukprot:459408-Alexandrium_andersonii.AAC.1
MSAPRFGGPPRWSSRARLACLEGLVAANAWVCLRRKARGGRVHVQAGVGAGCLHPSGRP